MVKIFLILAAAGVPLAAQIFPAEAKLEKLYEGGHLTEGAAVASDGTVYFSDITFTTETRMQAGHILRYDPSTNKTVVYRSPSGMSNGIKFDAQGRMVVAEGADYGGRRITRTDLTTGRALFLPGFTRASRSTHQMTSRSTRRDGSTSATRGISVMNRWNSLSWPCTESILMDRFIVSLPMPASQTESLSRPTRRLSTSSATTMASSASIACRRAPPREREGWS